MRRENLYYAQLGEALTLSQSNIFEYKRISLILFDNIVENLLQSQNHQKLIHLLVIGEINKTKFDKSIRGFDKFNNIVRHAKILNLINEKEEPIIKFCHKARNKLYHSLFEDIRITDFCIQFYCNFLERNFISFLETGITSYSDCENSSTIKILEKEGISNLSDIIKKIQERNKMQRVSPQEILSDIISDFIQLFVSFYENDSVEDWDKFNNTAQIQYFYNFEIKQNKNKNLDSSLFFIDFKRKWYNLNFKKIIKLKESASQLKKLSIENAFEKFSNLFSYLNPIYIGIMLHYSEQEYLASLNKQ